MRQATLEPVWCIWPSVLGQQRPACLLRRAGGEGVPVQVDRRSVFAALAQLAREEVAQIVGVPRAVAIPRESGARPFDGLVVATRSLVRPRDLQRLIWPNALAPVRFYQRVGISYGKRPPDHRLSQPEFRLMQPVIPLPCVAVRGRVDLQPLRLDNLAKCSEPLRPEHMRIFPSRSDEVVQPAAQLQLRQALCERGRVGAAFLARLQMQVCKPLGH